MRKPDRNVYVILLRDEVFTEKKKFSEANKHYEKLKPCVYVGRTVRSPEERLDQHIKGYKASRYVKKYGVKLLPELYKGINPMLYDEAVKKEVELANELRKKGYAVWQR